MERTVRLLLFTLWLSSCRTQEKTIGRLDALDSFKLKAVDAEKKTEEFKKWIDSLKLKLQKDTSGITPYDNEPIIVDSTEVKRQNY